VPVVETDFAPSACHLCIKNQK